MSKIVVGSRALFLQRHFEGLSNWVAKSDLKLLLPSRPSNQVDKEFLGWKIIKVNIIKIFMFLYLNPINSSPSSSMFTYLVILC